MTKRQFRRMTVFALRMVPFAIGGKRWQNELREHVSDLLDIIEHDMERIINWDNCTQLPDDDGTCGFAWSHHTPYLCDTVREYLWGHNLEREKEDRHGNCEVVESKMGVALSCCIRAACDVACAPSAGVLGWTVDDIRQMWRNRKVPQWIKDFFTGDFDTFNGTDPVWL